MTSANHLIRDRLCHTAIKDEVFSMELTFKPFAFNLVFVLNDPSVELVYVFKPMVLEERTRFFTADAARAVEKNLLIFFVLKKI